MCTKNLPNNIPAVFATLMLGLITAVGCGSDTGETLDSDSSTIAQSSSLAATDSCDLDGRYFILDTTECASSGCGKGIEFLARVFK